MMTLSTAATCLLLLLAQTPATPPPPAAAAESPPAEPLRVWHVPVAQVPAGTSLVLRAEVAPVWRLAALVVHHRTAGETVFQTTAFELSADGTHAASLPVPATQRVPVEYYVTARDTAGEETVRFASAERPYPVLIDVPRSLLEREALLEVYGQRRSRVGAFAEHVDYGATRIVGRRSVDRYYRVEADYLYRLFTPVGELRLDSIRIGVGHLRAQTPPFGATQPEDPRTPGLDYGFSEVDVSLHPLFGLGAKLVLGGNLNGFAAGFGGKLRIGRPHGARAELEGEFVQGLGGLGTLRLAWDTVPRFPMSAAVQVTNVPTGPVGLRLLYRVGYQVSDAVLVGAQAGYQARTSIGGGPTLGLLTSYSW
ncbi:hypothetical protein [Melittangium boletus]|uniref:hypothetical protein n=1 Tax=Melittangium boletus TaxID=83453 RepID=UPI003DA61821